MLVDLERLKNNQYIMVRHICGYTEQESKDILNEIMKDADGLLEMILENRKD